MHFLVLSVVEQSLYVLDDDDKNFTKFLVLLKVTFAFKSCEVVIYIF